MCVKQGVHCKSGSQYSHMLSPGRIPGSCQEITLTKIPHMRKTYKRILINIAERSDMMQGAIGSIGDSDNHLGAGFVCVYKIFFFGK